MSDYDEALWEERDVDPEVEYSTVDDELADRGLSIRDFI